LIEKYKGMKYRGLKRKASSNDEGREGMECEKLEVQPKERASKGGCGVGMKR